MNIGIFTYRQAPYISANTAIGYEIGIQLKKYSHNVFYIGTKQSEEQSEDDIFNDIPIRYINSDLDFDKHSRLQNKLYSIVGEEKKYFKEAKKLKKIVQENNIKALIVVFAPVQTLLITSIAKLDIPVILYQLDPYYNLNMIIDNKKKKEFIKYIDKFSCLFTTEELYEEYKNDNELSYCLHKIIPQGFPKIKEIKVESFPNETTTLSYIGSLYYKIRNPKILLNFSELLPENTIVNFLGSADCNLDEIENCKKIDYKRYCSQEVSLSSMRTSDFLINIGNSITNQLGSKLIDYIATGKPIINIYQTDKCPTLKVLEKYPFKLNIYSEDLSSCSAQLKSEINSFLQKYKGCCIPYDEIKKLYYEYTPQYVCEAIVKEIKKYGDK